MISYMLNTIIKELSGCI